MMILHHCEEAGQIIFKMIHLPQVLNQASTEAALRKIRFLEK